MRRVTHIALRILLAGLFLVVLLVVALVCFTRTQSFSDLLRTKVNALLAATYQGQITVAQIDSSYPGRLLMRNLTIQYEGQVIARIREVSVDYSLLPLLWGHVRLDISAVDPEARLARDQRGNWNLIAAFTPRVVSKGTTATSFVIDISALTVQEGAVEVAPDSVHGPTYNLDHVNLQAAIAISSDNLVARLTQLQLQLKTPSMPTAYVKTAIFYDATHNRSRIEVTQLSVATAHSALSASGTIDDLRTFSSNLQVSITRLSRADLSQILADYPWQQDISGTITVTGPLDAMTLQAHLASASARLAARLFGDFAAKQPSIKLDLQLAHLDLHDLQLGQRAAGRLDASVNASVTDLKPEAVKAGVSAVGQNLQLGNMLFGNLTLDARAQDGNTQFAARLDNGPGQLNLSGSASLIPPRRCSAVLNLTRFDLHRILSSLPANSLNGKVTAEAVGSDLDTASGHLTVALRGSQFAQFPLNANIAAVLANGSVAIDRAEVLSSTTRLSVSGTVGVARGLPTLLSYQVYAPRLDPLARLAKISAQGTLNLQGNARGVLRGKSGPSFDTGGKLTVRAIHVASIAVENGNLDYRLHGIGAPGWPAGEVVTQLNAVVINTIKFPGISAHLRTSGGDAPRSVISLVVRDHNNHVNEVHSSIDYSSQGIRGELSRVRLVLADGIWQLASPAQFVNNSHQAAIQRFVLINGVRQLSIDANLASSGEQSAVVHVRTLDLALLQPLMGPDIKAAGTVSGDLIIAGTAQAPVIRTSLQGRNLALNRHSFGKLDTTASYAAGLAQFTLLLDQDATHRLSADGHLPMTLAWHRGVALVIGNSEQVRIYSDAIDLAPLGPLLADRLKNFAGILRLDLTLTGQPFRPDINGTLAVDSAHAEVIATGVTISDLTLALNVSPQQITIARLSANAGSGSLTGHGTISLRQPYSPEAISASVQFNRWPAIATDQYKSTLDGELIASGTATMPVITGTLNLRDTTIHPSLDFLSGSNVPPPDKTILIVRPGQPLPAATPADQSSMVVAPPQSLAVPTFRNLRVDIRVNLHRNTWIRHENAEVELDGRVRITKDPGGPIMLIGEVDTVRGWVNFHDKRFNLVSGRILFTGGSTVNPSLDIDAQYVINQYTIDILVTGTAAKPQIKLQSQPQLAQADILSLILFGTTTDQLSQNQKSNLQQQAQSMALGAAGQALAQSLGLESLGVTVSGESVSFGHYIGRNTYISFAPSFGPSTPGAPTQVAAVQYFLRRWLNVTTATMSDGSHQIFLNINRRY
ncbi:MAG TPA: translocation/assembly module TamB [Candidatus Binataceae bacterium]|nr:translocation/assembly module TamB [Candidatus Binataceae bacterium]